jgi:DNA-binding transcriptional ArsR family regulator
MSSLEGCLNEQPVRPPTAAEMRALGHPTRLRIIRLCREVALTNHELADRLDLAPATVLRHVRTLLATGLLSAEEVRNGQRGALERPYRSTGLSTLLAWDAAEAPELLQQVEIAMLHAHRAELLEAGPDAIRDRLRYTLRLTARSQLELRQRLRSLLAEFAELDEPAGEPLSLLWLLHASPDRPGET